jgi:hypothetical protein
VHYPYHRSLPDISLKGNHPSRLTCNPDTTGSDICPKSTRTSTTTGGITIALLYYAEPAMLLRQLEQFTSYPKDLREQLTASSLEEEKALLPNYLTGRLTTSPVVLFSSVQFSSVLPTILWETTTTIFLLPIRRTWQIFRSMSQRSPPIQLWRSRCIHLAEPPCATFPLVE